MPIWPNTIPHDFRIALEERRVDDWETALRSWAKSYGLRLKIQWFAQLERRMVDLHSMRFTAGAQDHWAVIKEWLERHDVSAPEKLPQRPPQESANRYRNVG